MQVGDHKENVKVNYARTVLTYNVMLAFPQERMDDSWEKEAKAGPSKYELQQVYNFTFSSKSINENFIQRYHFNVCMFFSN